MANALHDIRLLKLFACVVRHQGFAAAQQELNLSTSAISTYMSQLEGQLGVTLCHRGRGGFALTSKGELFHQKFCASWARSMASNAMPPPSGAN